MNFRHRFMARHYLLYTLGLALSFTAVLLIYIHIKQEFLQDFSIRLPQSYGLRFIRPLYWWLLMTVPLDVGIRKLLQMRSKSESN